MKIDARMLARFTGGVDVIVGSDSGHSATASTDDWKSDDPSPYYRCCADAKEVCKASCAAHHGGINVQRSHREQPGPYDFDCKYVCHCNDGANPGGLPIGERLWS